MKHIILTIFLINSLFANAKEPLFIVKVELEQAVLEGHAYKDMTELKNKLIELKSPNEVMLHVTSCENKALLAKLAGALQLHFKLHIYNTKLQKLCSN